MENSIWFTLVILASIIGALCTFSDNYIADVFFRGRLPQSQKVFLGPAYILTAFAIILLFPIQPIPLTSIIILLLVGAVTSLSDIPYRIALSKDDTTNVSLLQQISPIFYLIFGRMFLDQEISGWQLLAFIIVIIAPLIIIFSSRGRNRENKAKTSGLILIKSLLGALAGTLIVKFSQDFDIITVLFYSTLGRGLFSVFAALLRKNWQHRFKNVVRQNHGVKNLHFWFTLSMNHIFRVASSFIYYAALFLAPSVAVASVVAKTLDPIFVFSLGIVLSILWPNFGREKIQRRAILTHFTATTIAVIGIILMQIL